MNFANFTDLAAENVPIKPAVGDRRNLLTHSTLSEKTNEMANVLKTLDVAPGERVAIHLQNRVEFLIAHLGSNETRGSPSSNQYAIYR